MTSSHVQTNHSRDPRTVFRTVQAGTGCRACARRVLQTAVNSCLFCASTHKWNVYCDTLRLTHDSTQIVERLRYRCDASRGKLLLRKKSSLMRSCSSKTKSQSRVKTLWSESACEHEVKLVLPLCQAHKFWWRTQLQDD